MALAISNQVNIGDILRLALPLDTDFLGSPNHTRRPVKWVTPLVSWQGLAAQVEKDDLVLVPSTLSTVDWASQIAKLAQLGVTAVILFDIANTAAQKAANTFDIPLIIISKGRTVREVHQAIAALLADQKTATSERGMQLYRQLSVMSREDQGLQAMTDVMSKLTGKIVVIQDKRLDIQAMSVPSNNEIDLGDLRNALQQREGLPPVLRNRKQAAHIRQSYWQQMLLGEEIGRLLSPIIAGDRARGYLSVVGYASSLDLLDTLTVENGALACALEMAKAKAVSEVRKELRGDFLEGLISGTFSMKEINRLSKRLDHDTQPPHAVMVFAWDGLNSPSLRRLETAINWVLSNHTRPALVHIHPDEHISIFQAFKDDGDMETVSDLAARIEQQISEEFSKARIVGGMSGPAHGLEEWPKVYTEAVQAMQLCQRLGLPHTVEFGSLGVYRLLTGLEDNPSVQQFAEQVLGSLGQYDDQHHGSLIETIDAFFKHHGNISRTAESLYVHRNTLLYRLERIQELTNHDLNQSDMRLALHLALKLWQLRPKK